MAFDFLGSFSKQDIESLRSYLQGELSKVDAQTNDMILEMNKHEKTLAQLLEFATRTGTKTSDFEGTFDKRVNFQVDDSDSALLVQATKQPYYQNLKIKEEVQHKIRKTRDLLEQLEEQVHYLRMSKTEFATNFEKINSLFNANRPYLKVEKDVS